MYRLHDTHDLEELRTFVALAATGSFASTASIIGRDATMVSRRLQSLEKRLGIRLADRTTRSFNLTEAGRAYLDRIKPLLDELDIASSEASAFAKGTPRGRLRVALPGSFARIWLEPIVVSFLKAHPEITLDARYSNAFVDLVGDGFDVAIRVGEMIDSRLIARKIGTRRRLVCASAEYLAEHGEPQSPEDVANHLCLCFTARSEPYRWEFRKADGSKLTVVVRCHTSSDDADLLVAAARAGLGLFYTTDWHVGPLLASGELVEILKDYPVADDGGIYVLTPAGGGMPTKTRAFSDWVATGLVQPPWLQALR